MAETAKLVRDKEAEHLRHGLSLMKTNAEGFKQGVDPVNSSSGKFLALSHALFCDCHVLAIEPDNPLRYAEILEKLSELGKMFGVDTEEIEKIVESRREQLGSYKMGMLHRRKLGGPF